MTIGLPGLDRLRGPLLTEASRKSCRRYVNHTLLKKSEDRDPRVSQAGREAIPRF